jgi:hypothetical protein
LDRRGDKQVVAFETSHGKDIRDIVHHLKD